MKTVTPRHRQKINWSPRARFASVVNARQSDIQQANVDQSTKPLVTVRSTVIPSGARMHRTRIASALSAMPIPYAAQRKPKETRGSIENDADGRNIADANDKAADTCTISVDDQTDDGNDVPREVSEAMVTPPPRSWQERVRSNPSKASGHRDRSA